MPDYSSFFGSMVSSYRRPRTMEKLRDSFGQKLFERYHIKFLAPKITEELAPYFMQHTFGGIMNNWSYHPSVASIDYDNLAERIIKGHRYDNKYQPSTDPNFQSKFYLSTINPFYLIPYIKRHEYNHALAHSIPASLAHIYGQKKYHQMYQDGYFRYPDESYDKWILSGEIADWMNGKYRPTGLECLLLKTVENETRQERLIRFVNDLDKKLDSLETEENLDYVNASIENEMLNGYGCFLEDMNVH